ncbi:hypothetical protein D3236_03240 [Staphylococcus aureus]|nr:hypothetical protein AA961_07915 [Staphylococcus aureus]RIX61979.1 hypothetical protein D3237_02885 [Staphylococcus aureus]RIX66068.1 hypothetical protein D3236_03240 [Staphylococcus aureus]RIX68167.1 hypothetical protein D3239_00165 [Staphylococcus aureus]RIX74722.1 hypothetical protein D3232_02095 [Staphylococcus aureus]
MMIESGTSQCPRLYNVILAGYQHREFRKEILQAMEVGDGAPTQRNWNPNFNRQWKLGMGPQHREFRKEILQAMPVGDNEFNFVKISFLSHSLCMNLIMYSYF